MRAAGERATQDSAAGISSPAAADKQPATPNVAGAYGHPRAASSSACSAMGCSPLDVDPDVEVVYLGESDTPSESNSPAKPVRKAVLSEITTTELRGSLDKTMRDDMLSLFDASDHSSRGSNRSLSHLDDASAEHEDIGRHDDVDDS